MAILYQSGRSLHSPDNYHNPSFPKTGLNCYHSSDGLATGRLPLTIESMSVSAAVPTMAQSSVQLDPLNSPHPVPWNWVLATHADVSSKSGSGIRYYRTQSLLSPDGQYAAYSRLQIDVESQLCRCRVSSVMFVENLQTGDLQTITASSPLAAHPFSTSKAADLPGTIAILIPISWSPNSDRVLGREFEALFNTSDASDYAVVWERDLNSTSTVSPTRIQYSNAILLGWSQIYPDRVLFRAGTIGDKDWPLWAVELNGATVAAKGDRPMIFGRAANNVWAGPQAYG